MIEKLILPEEITAIFTKTPSLVFANEISDLENLAYGEGKNSIWQVSYELPNGEKIVEAEVVRVKNGVSANYTDPYMRRRDPDCMFIADDCPSDKPRFHDQF